MNVNIDPKNNIVPFRFPTPSKIEYGIENPEDWITTKEKISSPNNTQKQELENPKAKVKKLEYVKN